jgi:hypothetical protein
MQRQMRAAADTSPATWSKADASAYLDGRATYWLGWGGSSRGHGTACISCHTGLPIALAQAAVDKPAVGLMSADPAELAMLNDVKTRVAGWDNVVSSSKNDQCVAYYTDQKPAALGTESVMNALVLVNHDVRRSKGVLSPDTRTAFQYLWDEQQSDGSWRWLEFGLKPWESDGTYYGAALAAVAVGMAGKDYYSKPDIQPNIVLLRKYLRTLYAARPLHDQVVCLWASTYLPGILSADEQSDLVQQLYADQEADGGWSMTKLGISRSNTGGWGSGGMYPPGSDSDGFATGLVVLSLKRLGISSHTPQLAKATVWLASSERSGSWPANYINGSRDPQSNEGQFMRDAATGFAVLALSEPGKQ